jgi:hypothetical protein
MTHTCSNEGSSLELARVVATSLVRRIAAVFSHSPIVAPFTIGFQHRLDFIVLLLSCRDHFELLEYQIIVQFIEMGLWCVFIGKGGTGSNTRLVASAYWSNTTFAPLWTWGNGKMRSFFGRFKKNARIECVPQCRLMHSGCYPCNALRVPGGDDAFKPTEVAAIAAAVLM